MCGWYESGVNESNHVPLADCYQDCGVEIKRLVEFAKKLGVQHRLAIETASCLQNPNVSNLVYRAPGNNTKYRTDEDWKISGLKERLDRPTPALAHLLWKTASDQPNDDWLEARYCNNQRQELRKEPSQVVCLLRDCEWVPQTDGRFVRPAEASRELLPDGFPFDSGWSWLKAIRFGEETEKKVEVVKKKKAAAKELGFEDDESLEDAKWFASLSREQRQQFRLEQQQRQVEFPERESRSSERRSQVVGEQAVDAPERITETRERSVSVNRDAVKEDAKSYLRHQYTNDAGQMLCQACQAEMPFTLADGSYFFEAVEFIGDPSLPKHHKQNYLALCPNHSAMFRHANGHDAEELREMFKAMEDEELEVVLAQQDCTIRFTEMHRSDLLSVINVMES